MPDFDFKISFRFDGPMFAMGYLASIIVADDLSRWLLLPLLLLCFRKGD